MPSASRKILPKSFFNRPTLVVARELLGKYIVRRVSSRRGSYRGHEIALMITEVEAYDGLEDLASHASRKRYSEKAFKNPSNVMTGRASVMFGAAGVWYVYFTYGIHWMLNIVTGPRNYPAAILIRGTDAVAGPARITKFLGLTGALTGKPAAGSQARTTGLWIEDRDVRIPRSRIITSPRIGVEYAGPIWAGKEWNLKLKSRD